MAVLVTAFFSVVPGHVCRAARSGPDATAVYDLLDLFDRLERLHPDFREQQAVLERLSYDERMKAAELVIEATLEDPEVSAAIDQLLGLPAYRCYYQQTGNITAETHRRILAALPVCAINSPADISRQLLDLFPHRGKLRGWLDDVLSSVDIDSAVIIARRLLPEGRYEAPPIYFIYDGNFGAFAGDSAVVFDILGVVLSRLPAESRFHHLSTISPDEFTGVIGHELWHVFSGERLYSHALPESASWRESQRMMLLLRMVSEGIAQHNNPPTGLSLATKTDTAIIAFWAAKFNRMNERLKSDDNLTSDEYFQWLRASYHDGASLLLASYLAERAAPDSVAVLARRHAADRPSLVYALGWWMASRISENGAFPERLISLPDNPEQMIEQYNETVADGADSLIIRW